MVLIAPSELSRTVDRYLAYLKERLEIAEPSTFTSSSDFKLAAKWRYEELVEVRSAFLKMFDPEPGDTPIE